METVIVISIDKKGGYVRTATKEPFYPEEKEEVLAFVKDKVLLIDYPTLELIAGGHLPVQPSCIYVTLDGETDLESKLDNIKTNHPDMVPIYDEKNYEDVIACISRCYGEKRVFVLFEGKRIDDIINNHLCEELFLVKCMGDMGCEEVSENASILLSLNTSNRDICVKGNIRYFYDRQPLVIGHYNMRNKSHVE